MEGIVIDTAGIINVSFYIFSLLKYDRIFGKNLKHDTYGVKQSPWPNTLWGDTFK